MSRAVSTAQTSLVDLTADALGAVFRWLASSDLASMPYVCRHLRDAMIVTGVLTVEAERPASQPSSTRILTGALLDRQDI